jgi:hypothetical protein
MMSAVCIVVATSVGNISDNPIDLLGVSSWLFQLIGMSGAVSVQVYRAWARDRWESEWSHPM